MIDGRMEKIKEERQLEDLFGYKDLTLKKEASALPLIGIWWLYKGKVIMVSRPYTQGGMMRRRDSKNPMVMNEFYYNKIGSHQTYWLSSVIKDNPELSSKSYEFIPRGRVELLKLKASFEVILLCSKELANLGENHKVIKEIKAEHNALNFDLTFQPDNHYGVSPDVFSQVIKSFK